MSKFVFAFLSANDAAFILGWRCLFGKARWHFRIGNSFLRGNYDHHAFMRISRCIALCSLIELFFHTDSRLQLYLTRLSDVSCFAQRSPKKYVDVIWSKPIFCLHLIEFNDFSSQKSSIASLFFSRAVLKISRCFWSLAAASLSIVFRGFTSLAIGPSCIKASGQVTAQSVTCRQLPA